MPEVEDITFYVPARDCEATLAACLESINAQTLRPTEIIVVLDRRSADRTEAIARSFDVGIVNQHEGKLGYARNLAVRAARTRWLACCDADVTLQPDWLEVLASSRDAVVAVGGRTEEKIYTPADRWRAINMPHNWGQAPLLNPFMLVSEVLFDRRALLAVGGYREDLQAFEDSDLCQRLHDAGYDLYYQPRAEAWHHRGDSILDVLDLRWKYAEFRQRPLLDRFAGLIEKTRVNREYALNTLAKTVALDRDDLSYVSVLLFFHHLLLDLRSLLTKRPLLPDELRRTALLSLRDTIVRSIARGHGDLAGAVAQDFAHMRIDPRLSGTEPRPPGPISGLDRGRELLRQQDSCRNGRMCSGTDVPAWPGYLDAIAAAIAAFLRELPPRALDTAVESAASLRAPDQDLPVTPVARLPRQITQAELDRMPLAPFLSRQVLGRWQKLLGSSRRILLLGPVAEPDRRLLEDNFETDQVPPPGSGAIGRPFGPPTDDAVAALLHLERFADPLDLLAGVLQTYRHAVVSYRCPVRFLPGLDVLQARDLASAAARCGARIRSFETLIGQTTLILERTKSSSPAVPPIHMCGSEGLPCSQRTGRDVLAGTEHLL